MARRKAMPPLAVLAALPLPRRSYSRKSTITGAWSEGRSQPRLSRKTGRIEARLKAFADPNMVEPPPRSDTSHLARDNSTTLESLLGRQEMAQHVNHGPASRSRLSFSTSTACD